MGVSDTIMCAEKLPELLYQKKKDSATAQKSDLCYISIIWINGSIIKRNNGGWGMMSEIIVYTKNYKSLVDLFVRAGLEIDPNDPEPEGLVTCMKLVDAETGNKYGAGGLCYNGEYILRCIAVEEEYRGKGYGKRLVEAVMEEAKKRGAARIWLTAKVPEFYKKFGFRVVPRESAPFITKCGECPQYHNGCDSEVMVYDYE